MNVPAYRRIGKEDLAAFDKLHRVTLVNALPGFKSANLIGTVDAAGRTNLAVFSSVIHLGSSPALMGFVTRPTTVDRHTYANIRTSGYYTINHVPVTHVRNAHQTSARYEASTSEFDACHFTAFYTDAHPAPYVAESPVRLGMRYLEHYQIEANGTILVVGEVIEALVPVGSVAGDGHLDLVEAGTALISGLDTYLRAEPIARFAYAKPGTATHELRKERRAAN